MNNKIKLLGSALGICLISSNAWAVDKGQWQLNGSYEKGDTVTNLGVSYECLVAGWCSGGNKLYEPGVKGNEWAWQTAWKEAGPGPSPTPQEKVTATISVSNDIPEGTTINFKGSNGYTVSGKNNSQIVLEYDKDGSTTYKVSIDSKVGNITPESITVDQNTSSISLKYAKPTPPTPGKCDPEPSNIEDFAPSGPGHWGGYSKGDFVKYEGNIYELLDSYWTADAPGTPNTWVKCGSVISATVNVTTVGLPSDVKSYPLKIDQQQHTVSVLSPEAISLAKGQHSFSVDPVMSSSDVQNYYIGTPSPKNIDVTKTSTINLNVTFTKKPVQQTDISFNVLYPTEAKPSSALKATLANNSGSYSQQVIINSGSNTIQVPSVGEFTLKPDSYDVDGVKYVAPSLTIKDGKIIGDDQLQYAKDDLVLAAYMPVSWNDSPTISVAAQKGYNIILPSFVEIKGNSDIKFTSDVFLPYTTWNNKASDPTYIEKIKDDIALAKSKYHLKYVLASVGGQNNTYDPGANADYDALAQKTVAFLDKYGFDGIDFDLEGVPADVTQDSLETFIKALKKQKSDIIISGAPQVVNVGGKLDYVNTGSQQVYKKAIDEGLFNYLFVQEYNTGGNYVDSQGNICSQGDECYDETSAGFIKNSYYALEKVTPKVTKIVAGEPATGPAAGSATVFNGPDAETPYKSMCVNYQALNGQSQYGGAMTWEISYDKGNDYKFANMVTSAFNNACDQMI